jgi:type IV pilus assembly protein PilM
MFNRTYLGLEIRRKGLHAIALQRKGKQLILTGGEAIKMEDTLVQPGFNSPNVLHPESFVRSVKNVLEPLVRRDNRIAIALPDSTGSLFLLDVETPFKNRAEGAEIVRWQLKDLLPDRVKQLTVDYQVLEEKESGHKKILAAAVSRDVLHHYEALIEQAGFAAAVIDFHSLALYNAYRSKIDFGHDFILIGVDGCQLSIQVFINQVPVFYRVRQIDQDIQQVFQEINRSLVGCRADLPSFSRMPVYLHSDWPSEELTVVVEAVFDQPVQWLASPVSKLINGHKVNFADDDAHSMSAALGVAERMIQGGA